MGIWNDCHYVHGRMCGDDVTQGHCLTVGERELEFAVGRWGSRDGVAGRCEQRPLGAQFVERGRQRRQTGPPPRLRLTGDTTGNGAVVDLLGKLQGRSDRSAAGIIFCSTASTS